MPRSFNIIRGNATETNIINGTDADDIIYGGNNVDFLSGGAGNDIVIGGDGRDFLSGGDGADYLFGGAGFDNLFGGAGDDVLRGSEGVDIMEGGDGNDTFILTDEDTAKGDAGADKFIWRVRDDETVSISDFDASEGDIMRLKGKNGLEWETIESDNYTSVAFSNGATINFYGYTAEEIQEDPGLFGL